MDFEKYKSNKISIKTSTFGKFTTHTCTPKTKKSEDEFFEKNINLVNLLTRACTFVFCDNNFVTCLQGPIKFTGYDNIDEDPADNEYMGKKILSLFNKETITKWQDDNELEVFITKKENGKFAIAKFFNYENKDYIICGSKNVHVIISLDELYNYK